MTDTNATPNREQRRSGYRRKTKALRLHFEGTELDGLEVLMRSVPVATILDLAEMSELATKFTPEGVQKLGEVFELLAQALLSWNMEDELCDAHSDMDCEVCPPDAPHTVVPVPSNLDGIKSLDLGEALLLVQHWTQAAAGVGGPLAQTSPGGRLSEVASLPMEPPSQSQAS